MVNFLQKILLCNMGAIYHQHPLFVEQNLLKWRNFFYEAGILDYPLQLNYLTKGTIYYFDRIMSVYRHYHNGSWGKEQISDRKKRLMHSIKMIHFLSQYNWYTDKIYEKYIISRRQGYLSYALNLYKDKTKRGFFTICDEVKKEMDIPYHNYFMKIKSICTNK